MIGQALKIQVVLFSYVSLVGVKDFHLFKTNLGPLRLPHPRMGAQFTSLPKDNEMYCKVSPVRGHLFRVWPPSTELSFSHLTETAYADSHGYSPCRWPTTSNEKVRLNLISYLWRVIIVANVIQKFTLAARDSYMLKYFLQALSTA